MIHPSAVVAPPVYRYSLSWHRSGRKTPEVGVASSRVVSPGQHMLLYYGLVRRAVEADAGSCPEGVRVGVPVEMPDMFARRSAVLLPASMNRRRTLVRFSVRVFGQPACLSVALCLPPPFVVTVSLSNALRVARLLVELEKTLVDLSKTTSRSEALYE